MKILVTGAKGFVGKNLCWALKNLRDGKDRTRPSLRIDEVWEYDIDSVPEQLSEWCQKADFVFNLAGVNRPQNQEEFMEGNFGFASTLLDTLKKYGNTCPVMLSSSQQASLTGRFGNSEYGRSKKAGEDLFLKYQEETGAKVLIYRFPNLFGKWCRPNYNSAVATFCNAFANGLPYTVNDPSVELELLYIDDLVDEMLNALEGQEHRCEFNGLEVVPTSNLSTTPTPPYHNEGLQPSPQTPQPSPGQGLNRSSCRSDIKVSSDHQRSGLGNEGHGLDSLSVGRYCYCPVTHRATLGEIVELLKSFAEQPRTLMVPEIPNGSFAKKLYSTYLSYLPYEKTAFPLKMNVDERGSFTELVHTLNSGQVSINISKPGITKGQHWHHTKFEQFIVVKGHGLIQQRNLNDPDGRVLEWEVDGEHIQAVHMLPGYTHNIINLSDAEDLVTVMYCNEVFDPGKPDTFFEPVE